MVEQMTILGPGLLGASLAMVVKDRRLVNSVHTWSRRAETRAKCITEDWCDKVFETAAEACEGSDLIVLCTPVETIAPLIRQISNSLAPGALITDVGSTKSLICKEATDAVPDSATFIGSHPMAGSERSGLENANIQLFKGATCLVTPLPTTQAAETDRLIEFWEAIDMQTAIVSPEKHDEIVAHISHLPHLLASTLCGLLANKDASWGHFSGGGLKDSTRVASGDPSLWRQILEQNREEVISAICGLEGELHLMKTALLDKETHKLVALLERGKNYRDQL